MEKTASRKIYEQRIYRVQDYICSHLSHQLSLEKLAPIAAFSPFHFHRIFKSITNESLYDFIQRKRLEKACALLSSSNEIKISNIALDCGFATASSFSKSFQQHFKTSPSQYRSSIRQEKRNAGTPDSKYGTSYGKIGKEMASAIEYICANKQDTSSNRRKPMEIHIEQLPIYHIAYMRKIGPYGYENAALMGALKKWAMARDLLTESATILGIAHDDPEVTPPEKCRYDACIVLPQEHPFDNSINENSLPGGKYAILSVEHTAEAIGKAWNYAFTKWLPDSGFEIDERPIFERYAAEAAVCDLCIPVKPL